MGQGKIESSLLPQEIRKAKIWQEKTKWFAAAAAVFLLGAGVPFGMYYFHNDKFETMAIKKAFGEHAYKLAISATKSMTGHLLGAAGGVEGVFSVLAIHRNMLLPTINYVTPDPECDLDYVPNQAREAHLNYALSNSFGFGGTNAALLFKRYEE